MPTVATHSKSNSFFVPSCRASMNVGAFRRSLASGCITAYGSIARIIGLASRGPEMANRDHPDSETAGKPMAEARRHLNFLMRGGLPLPFASSGVTAYRVNMIIGQQKIA